MRHSFEINFDGIVGPSHNYSGLSYGNVASVKNQKLPSNPKQAALQGLQKMKYLMDLGLKQGILPPQERPFLPALRKMGFSGNDAEVLSKSFKEAPALFFLCGSSSSMWAANAATVSPSPDSEDGFVHITAANLQHTFHRSIEAPVTSAILKKIFHDVHHFKHHDPLPVGGNLFADEGAANHTRFCREFEEPGVQLFVYGKSFFDKNGQAPSLYPARQTYEASQLNAKQHLLKGVATIFARQNPQAIDAGVFHNDVISVGHKNLFLYHQLAFVDTEKVIQEIKEKVKTVCQTEMIFLMASEKEIPLKDAVDSYLFNSQIISLPDHSMRLIAPSECQEISSVKTFIEKILADRSNPIKDVHYFNLHESMRNGGGPACLRLRVVLTPKEVGAASPKFILTEMLYQQLVTWVEKYYRDYLLPEDLADPQFLREGQQALDELSKMLHLGSIYSFQQN